MGMGGSQVMQSLIAPPRPVTSLRHWRVFNWELVSDWHFTDYIGCSSESRLEGSRVEVNIWEPPEYRGNWALRLAAIIWEWVLIEKTRGPRTKTWRSPAVSGHGGKKELEKGAARTGRKPQVLWWPVETIFQGGMASCIKCCWPAGIQIMVLL